MVKIVRIACDYCGKEVDDRYSKEGWIYLSGGPVHQVRISVSKGRDAEGNPMKGKTSRKALDFCSTGCLKSYIEGLVEDGA